MVPAKNNGFVAPAFILGLALVLTGIVATAGFYNVKALSDVVSVTGSAEKQITSDVVKWTMQITHSTGLTDIQQGNAAMQGDLATLRAYLKKQGVEEAWVTVSPVTVETLYDYSRGGAPSGYTLRQTVTVEASDIATVKTASEEAGDLIGQGALVSTLSVEYFYSKLADLKQEILAAATADARARAQKIVESAGGKLGRLRSASMGVLQVTAVNSVEVSDYGAYDTSALEKKVTAVVRASFGLR